MLIKYRILLAGAASLLTLIACSSNDSALGTSATKDAVAATVNGVPISENLVSMMLKQRTELGRPASAEARNSFIDRLAMQLVISQEAVKKGMDKLPDVSAQLELGRQSILVNAFVKDYQKNNPISDGTLNTEYEKVKAQMAGTEYLAHHILVENEADAKDIIARLKKNPKAFDALAKEKSKDTGSKIKNGNLGWVDPRGVVPEFGAALKNLAKGKFTEEPVKSQFGYHVILMEDSRAKVIPPLEQINSQLRQQVQQKNMEKLFQDLKGKAKIEVVQAPAPAPAAAAKPADPVKK
ncbi:MAG: peptidylprolyl isomerase [Pseudomonadota bacterium]